MTTNLSVQAKKIYDFITDYQSAHEGRSPSVRDIGQKVNLSVRRVLLYLIELERSGIIKRSPYKARSIELLNDTAAPPEDEVVKIPVVGMTAGGGPILAEHNIQDYMPVSKKLIGPYASECFLLKLRGNSMNPYLSEGDYAIVRPITSPHENDIVVATVRDDSSGEYASTVKKFRRGARNHIILQPLNPDYQPIIIEPESSDLQIQGKVIGVIKLDVP